ncbi:MAG TPA: efflux RND transporter permease subunit [Gemmatales bacterium]|nr:efflux RND transporter permease subunit [Gemmatales bacterium]
MNSLLNPIVFALRRPVTIVAIVAALAAASLLAASRMPVDIFPALNLPVVYVCQPYGGLDPAQMEGLIANYYEYHFLYINGIKQVESKNVQGVSLMKLVFHPGTNMAQALAETVGYVNRSRAFMPPGTVPPFIMRFDTGSVPVGYLVLSSDSLTVGQIQDQALFKVRPMFAAIPGVSAPPPFGGNQRTVVVRADPSRLRAYGVSAEQVVQALASGNTISPSGQARVQERMPLVPINAMVTRPDELGDIPIRSGIYLRDVVRRDPITDTPLIEDASDIPAGYALANDRRAVYILVTKRADASTLEVVQNVKDNLNKMRAVLPPEIKVSFEFDQSPYVTNALWGVATEGGLGAILTGLMVLLFLRDWRSVIVVVLNIPLALLGSVLALAATGMTLNLMTLGGLALAVGILVDESTVEVENIHSQMETTDSVAVAVRRGNSDTAVPRFLAMLCVLAVFTPAIFMQGAARGLFLPLSLAVAFAMISSYLLSSTLVPVLCVWLLKKTPTTASHHGLIVTITNRIMPLVNGIIIGRMALVPLYLAGSAALLILLYSMIGIDLFPTADAGYLQLRVKAPIGTRIEQTEELSKQALKLIRQELGDNSIKMSLGYIGLVPSSYPINSVYLWTSGPEEAVIRVSVRSGLGTMESIKHKLRDRFYTELPPWIEKKWIDEGVPSDRARILAQQLRFSFEPADIINEVMSFGSPTPIEVVVSGPKLADDRAYAQKLYHAMSAIHSLRDVQIGQSLDYPTIEVKVDRQKAATSDVTVEQVAKAMTPFTSSTRFTVPNYWRDPNSGIGYQVQVEVPQTLVNSPQEIETIPVLNSQREQVMVRDVADVKEGTIPGELDRFNMRRLVSITANIEGIDLGRVDRQLQRMLAEVGAPPTGVTVEIRGQVTPLNELFQGLSFGLIVAVVAILFLLTAYFQSWQLSLVALSAVPAVLVGVLLCLLLTGSTLNLQSFMGAIMAVGVAVANAILLVTFAEDARRQPSKTGSVEHTTQAARVAVQKRLRPILMTSLAMCAGMLPLALGWGEGGSMSAPLARAVLGGLIASTLATLLIVPAVFVWVQGRRTTASISLDPQDPTSSHYHPPPASAS